MAIPIFALLKEQLSYYRARAAEYDEWFYRQGRYNRGKRENRIWFKEIAQVRKAVRTLPKMSSILEPACGTGLWTPLLLKLGQKVTAVDASPEMLAIHRARLGLQAKIEYHSVDLFNWTPQRQWEMVFVSFWLSHVPGELINRFLDQLCSWVSPGGYLFLLDSRYDPLSTAADHRLGDLDATIRVRKLNDGREFRIMKVFHSPEKLDSLIQKAGFSGSASITERFFMYGCYQKA